MSPTSRVRRMRTYNRDSKRTAESRAITIQRRQIRRAKGAHRT